SLHHLFHRGDLFQSTRLAEESVAVARETGDKGLIAIALDAAGVAALRGGTQERAEELLEESVSLLREVGSKWLICFSLIDLGFLAISCGDFERATTLCRESLALQERLADRWGMSLSLAVLAAAAAGQGQPERAARLLGAAEAFRESIGACHSDGTPADLERTAMVARDALSAAAFAAAWAHGRAMKLPQLLIYAATS